MQRKVGLVSAAMETCEIEAVALKLPHLLSYFGKLTLLYPVNTHWPDLSSTTTQVFTASIIRVTRIGELGTTLAVTSNRRC
jgi:hypothetical protein